MGCRIMKGVTEQCMARLRFTLDVAGPCIVILNLLGKSAGKVKFIFTFQSISQHNNSIHFSKIINFKIIANNLMQFIVICWCIV